MTGGRGPAQPIMTGPRSLGVQVTTASLTRRPPFPYDQAITEAGCSPQEVIAAYLHNVRVLHEDKASSGAVPAATNLSTIARAGAALLSEIAVASAAAPRCTPMTAMELQNMGQPQQPGLVTIPLLACALTDAAAASRDADAQAPCSAPLSNDLDALSDDSCESHHCYVCSSLIPAQSRSSAAAANANTLSARNRVRLHCWSVGWVCVAQLAGP